ncbi:MAG: class II fructose-bisphosphate aldolase [Planctomycetes bacterium]|nr:class II fructose-bisphosphate aldolase [Planctomycetota bacterium]
MPLVPARQILRDARRHRYCIAGFDVFNLELLEGVLRTCERLKSPVMFQTSFMNFDFYTKEHLFYMIKSLLESTSIPVTFHLDHGQREMPFDIILDCLKLGFPSVMADGSHLPIEENIALVRRVVTAAMPYGASVEGELGQVSRNPNATQEEIIAMMTDPDEAGEFVRDTHVDSLAISVGSITGCFDSKKVELDFNRLEKISRNVTIPLVFHGGTGITNDQMRKAIGLGVVKVNVAHGLRKIFVDTMRSGLGTDSKYIDPRPILADAMKNIEKYAEEKLDILGSIGKAR